MDPMTISLRRPFPTSELQRLDMNNNAFYWSTSGFTELYVRWFDCEVLFCYSLRESILMCLFNASKTNWEIVWKNFTLGAKKSASIVRVVSLKECNLCESSMLSPSILVNLSMLQRSCNLTQTLFIWWLWTCTKPRCHNWTKNFSQMRCNGGYIIFK